MPRGKGYNMPRGGAKAKANPGASSNRLAAFPANPTKPGTAYGGPPPPPTPARATVKNPLNVDPHGRATPWKAPGAKA